MNKKTEIRSLSIHIHLVKLKPTNMKKLVFVSVRFVYIHIHDPYQYPLET